MFVELFVRTNSMVRRRSVRRRGRRTKGAGLVRYVPAMYRAAASVLGKRRRGAGSGRAGKRRRYGSRNKNVRRKSTPGGDFLQFTTENHTMGRRLPAAVKDRRIVRAARESVIYSFKALKSFDDNGYHFMSNNVASGDMVGNNALPVYCLLLNGRTIGGSASATPLLRMYVRNIAGPEDGKLFWAPQVGNVVSGTGTGTSELLQLEYTSADPMPIGQRMHWDWSQVQFNLWGAKSKAVKWNIQICKISDEDVNPWNYLTDAESARVMSAEGQLAWLETVKQYVFNPLAKINVESVKSKIKVLKTWEKVIQPTTTIENDADPHAHVLKWFNRWNRNVDFDKKVIANGVVGLNDDVELYRPKDIMSGTSRPWQWYPDDKDVVFVMIRASAYTHSGAEEPITNSVYGSFDVTLRSKFTTLD